MAVKEIAFKEILTEMHDLFLGLLECADLLQKGLIYNNLRVIEGAAPDIMKVKELEGHLTEAVLKEAKAAPMAEKYVSFPSHMGKIAGNLERISSSIERKIREGVLFSDKAVAELNYLFERTRDILGNTRDMLLARNVIIANYIVQSEVELTRAANDFATKHEERLIEGLCQPVASSMFIEILDAFKGIAWHAREAARDLVGIKT